MNTKHKWFLAFKLLMLIIVKQLFLNLSWLLFLHSSQLQPPVTEIKTQRENIYVWMKNNRFEVKNVMLYFNVWKEIFQPCIPPSVYLYIYMNLTHTYIEIQDGWTGSFIIKHLVFTIGVLVAAQETYANVLYSWANIEVWLQNWTTFWWCNNHSM